MRIGLYGLPTAGKSFLLSTVKSLEVLSGSSLLKELSPEFHDLTEDKKAGARKQLALKLKNMDHFIMDGHYSFGDNVVFTEEDGQLYDAFLYLCVDPEILKKRMEDSVRNNKYLKYDIEKWQNCEMEALREYCHHNDKDFYVIDNPEKGFFPDISMILEFIDSIACGYSCIDYAREIVAQIPDEKIVTLVDGDKTFIAEDSSAILGYRTHLFDGNYYTGFQAWRHSKAMADYLKSIDYSCQSIDDMNLNVNEGVLGRIVKPTVLLTAGHYDTWKQMADKYRMPMFAGSQMSADTKYFVTKFLQIKGTKVVAFGDSMNDYYMLRQADLAYLVRKKDGSVSSSLKGRDLEGFVFV